MFKNYTNNAKNKKSMHCSHHNYYQLLLSLFEGNGKSNTKSISY